MPEQTQVLMEWHAPDAPAYQRGPRWYLFGAVCVLGFAAYGLFEGSWSTALLALLIGAMYFLMRNVPPREIAVQIDGLGIRIDAAHVSWNQVRDFWIIQIADRPQGKKGESAKEKRVELHLGRRSTFVPTTVIQIAEVDPGDVRSLLLTFLQEREGMEERFLDLLARMLKL